MNICPSLPFRGRISSKFTANLLIKKIIEGTVQKFAHTFLLRADCTLTDSGQRKYAMCLNKCQPKQTHEKKSLM